LTLDGVRGQRHATAALLVGKTQYTLYRKVGGSQGRSGEVRKIFPSLGFNPQTTQPIASCYFECLFPAHVQLRWQNVKHRN